MTTQEIKVNALQIRDIIEIDEELCNGCSQCVPGCAEGAIAIVDGKAKLVKDIYCDGLGACLGHCPTGALKIIKRAAPAFDEAAAMAQSGNAKTDQGCPGSKVQTFSLRPVNIAPDAANIDQTSQLASWPIQLKLVPVQAEFLDSPVLVLAADCTAFAGTSFHKIFLNEGHPLIIACPKLDDAEAYIDKMAEIIKAHPQIKEIRVPIMSVPCCGGLGYIVTQAIKKAGREGLIKQRIWTVTPQGEISEELR